MRITRMVLIALACVMQTACVTQQLTLPSATRAELIRLGRIIIDENETEEARCNSRMRYCELVRDAKKKFGEKSVDRQTVIESFVMNGREPKGLRLDGRMLDYEFERKDGTSVALTVYFGGWTGSYVWKAYPNGGIP